MARNILLRILGQNEDAKKAINEVADDAEKLKKEASGDIKIGVDADQAKRELKEIIAEAKLVPEDVTIRLRVEGEAARLETLARRLEVLQGNQSETAAAGGDTTAVTRQIGNVAAQIDAARGRIRNLTGDLEDLDAHEDNAGDHADNFGRRLNNLAVGALTRIGETLRETDNSLSRMRFGGGALGSIPGMLGTAVLKLAQVTEETGSAATGFSSLLVSGLSLASILPVLALIGGAIVALVSSLAMAVVGLLAMGAAFVIALGPIVAVLGAVAYQVSQAVSGQQAMQQSQASLTSAIDQQKQAVIQLQQAQQNESQQRLAALQAEKDAVLALKDAENQVADARLNVRSTALQVQQAKLALAQFDQQLIGFGLSPSSLDQRAANVDVAGNFGQTQQGASSTAWQSVLLQREQLVLAIAQAERSHADALTNVNDQLNNESKAQQQVSLYQKEGLRAFPGYLSSIQSVKTAMAQLATSTAQVASAQTAYNNAVVSAPAGLNGLVGVWDKLKSVLGQIFTPAMAGVIRGATTALGIFASHLAPLKPALKLLGDAIGNSFVALAKILTSPGMLSAIKELILNSAKMVGPLTKIFGYFLQIMLEVANAALPTVVKWLRQDVEPLFERIAKHPQAISKFIHDCIKQTQGWFSVLGTVAGAIITIAHVLQSIFNTVKDLLSPLGSVAKFLGIGIGGVTGIIAAAWAIIKAVGMLGGIGGIGGILGGIGRAGGGLLGDLGLMGGAAAAGVGIGTLISKIPGVKSTVGGLFSDIGLTGSTDPAAYAQKWNTNQLAAYVEKELETGLYGSLGKMAGQAIPATVEQEMLRVLRGMGVKGKVEVHNHFGSGPPTDPHHFSAVLRRRLTGHGASV